MSPSRSTPSSSRNPQASLDIAQSSSHFPIDPALTDSSFLPEDPAFDFTQHHPEDPEAVRELVDGSLGPEGEPKLDAADLSAITASLAQATAHHPPGRQRGKQRRQADGDLSDGASDRLGDSVPGSERQPLFSPGPSFAPYFKPQRDESTPHPLYIHFAARSEFEYWLQGEDSWTHYVLKRYTTPQMRADQRLRAREKAHAAQLATLSSDERGKLQPLRMRKRTSTSSVAEKITFTCHHAGHYTKQHDPSVPQDKWRTITKNSVKCNCQARIVLTEMQDGKCKAVYHWQHQGHDPFNDGGKEGGRLPKLVDEWIVAQVHAGKDPDAIRKSLQMSEEDKRAYIARAAADPGSVTADMPPPLALTLQVTYPDIYNRYRKLKGPIRQDRAGSGDGGKGKRKRSETSDDAEGTDGKANAPVSKSSRTPTAGPSAQRESTSLHHLDEPGQAGEIDADGSGMFSLHTDGADPNVVFREALQELSEAQLEGMARDSQAELAAALLTLPKGEREIWDFNEESLRQSSMQ